MEQPPDNHEPRTDLKHLFRNFASIIMFCVNEAEREMKEEKERKDIENKKKWV